MGATTIANKAYGVYNNKKVVEADVTFSGSYATAGDTVALTSLGLKRVDEVSVPSHHLTTKKVVATAGPRSGKTVELGGTSTAPKLLVYDLANTEVTAAANLSGVTVRLRFFGI